MVIGRERFTYDSGFAGHRNIFNLDSIDLLKQLKARAGLFLIAADWGFGP
jgi:hypothetical protein